MVEVGHEEIDLVQDGITRNYLTLNLSLFQNLRLLMDGLDDDDIIDDHKKRIETDDSFDIPAERDLWVGLRFYIKEDGHNSSDKISSFKSWISEQTMILESETE